MTGGAELILASASPRRRELLQQINVAFHQQVADVDETPLDAETAADFVVRLALHKATAVQARRAGIELPVLGADTAVVIDNRILGKPVDDDEAQSMLRLLSGCSHEVLSAVALVSDSQQEVRLSRSLVWFRKLSERDILAYLRSGETADKAGAYAIQGLGAILIERLEGSYSGVMGLPLFETADLLRKFGINVLDSNP
jgi:septum formation protein